MSKFAYLFGIFLTPTLCFASFPDVSTTHPNADAIHYVQEQNIVSGYPDGTYQADKTISRAEFTKIIIEAVANEFEIANCINSPSTFSDVAAADWYGRYVCVAKNKNIIGGYPDGTFKPANAITFAEAAKIIATGFDLETQANDIWYKPFVIALTGKHAIPTSISRLDKQITRGEMAEMVYRLKTVTLKPSTTYQALASTSLQPALIAQTTKIASVIKESPEDRCELRQNRTQESTYYFISPNGDRVIYAGCESDEKKFIFAHGVLHTNLDEVWDPIFSKDGKHDAFFTRKGDIWTLTVDGVSQVVPGELYNSEDTAMFGPDGTFVYIRKEPGDPEYSLIVNGVKQPYFTHYLPTFSADGKSMAYRAGPVVVFNNIPGKPYRFTSQPTLSPDGTQVAYFAIKSFGESEIAECVVVVQDKEEPYNCADDGTLGMMLFDNFPQIVFSPDGTAVAYPVLDSPGEIGTEGFEITKNPSIRVFANGVLSEAYSAMLASVIPVFNPVTNKVAFSIFRDNNGTAEYFVVYDGKELRKFAARPSLRSSHGILFTVDGKLSYVGATRDPDSEIIVTDGVEIGQIESVEDIILSPDGQRLAYFLQTEEVLPEGDPSYEALNASYGTIFTSLNFVAIEGQYTKPLPGFVRSVFFSPDSKHFAYIVRGERDTLFVDGKVRQHSYDAILTEPTFTSDGKIAFGARKGKEIWWVVEAVN